MKASHVIQIISENYQKSEVCLNEMGAAWVLNNKVIPFILSPVTFTTVGFIHQPNQLLRLNNSGDLLKFVDEIKTSDQPIKHSEAKRQVDEFLKIINAIEKDKDATSIQNQHFTQLAPVFQGRWNLRYVDKNGVANEESVEIDANGAYKGDSTLLYRIQFIQLQNERVIFHKIRLTDNQTHSVETLEVKSSHLITGSDDLNHALTYTKLT